MEFPQFLFLMFSSRGRFFFTLKVCISCIFIKSKRRARGFGGDARAGKGGVGEGSSNRWRADLDAREL